VFDECDDDCFVVDDFPCEDFVAVVVEATFVDFATVAIDSCAAAVDTFKSIFLDVVKVADAREVEVVVFGVIVAVVVVAVVIDIVDGDDSVVIDVTAGTVFCRKGAIVVTSDIAMVDAAETIAVDIAILDVLEVAAHEFTVIGVIDDREVAFVIGNLTCGTGIVVAAAIVDFFVACGFIVLVNSAGARSVGIISSALIAVVTGVRRLCACKRHCHTTILRQYVCHL
jgi:hypothetical protein